MTRQGEKLIQADLGVFMKARGWYVENTHGNAFQKGFPDMYCIHVDYGARWIDTKVPGKNSLTKAQRLKWPLWEANGGQIWILTAATEEEYRKLWLPPNWREFWKPSYGHIPSIDEILAALAQTDDENEIWRILNGNNVSTWEN